eukprot:COSAG03_NODE_15030_length_443_cov_0.904070_1_plen_22_part_10
MHADGELVDPDSVSSPSADGDE